MRTGYHPIGQLGGRGEGEAYSSRRDPQTVAWVVLSLAFATFCLLVLGAFWGGKWYYDTASVPRTSTLSVENGIVLFRDAVSSTLISAHDNLSLREGDDILVGQGARAYISLFEGSRVLLYSGSEMRETELKRSRFHDAFSRVGLRFERGIARIQVAPPTTQSAQFVVATPHGSALLTAGNFGLEVSEGQTRISARQGSASVWSARGAAQVRVGEKVLLTPDSITAPLPAGDQLLTNGNLSQGFTGWELLLVDEPGRPVEPSQRMLLTERIEGQETTALRVSRVSPAGTHNETGLIQVINKDVSDYEALLLQADVRVNEQSLSGGGYMGYEYPIMIRVRYRDAVGGQIDWSHGFFHRNPEGRPTPNGQEVPQGQWVGYRGDLMSVKPKPAHIISVEVLGAGHSFDGMIANVSLVGK